MNVINLLKNEGSPFTSGAENLLSVISDSLWLIAPYYEFHSQLVHEFYIRAIYPLFNYSECNSAALTSLTILNLFDPSPEIVGQSYLIGKTPKNANSDFLNYFQIRLLGACFWFKFIKWY